ncbi:hypothetical protein GC722_16875 [Auraticoccus sp. F435]|uniref:Acyl-CoA thioesterase n=1 Tax=Auraticoccus cholistanensis TaxID=2656650 RepID=A0A6A9V217_9ACTN|nr:thioesterase family protein [Auraticoccus cholistanensis]MVA77676.1 hypothetical protein [Auraticoccus cholistanensis]
MTHLFRCPLRWGDMDAQAHLNNGVYVDYLQEARVDFLTRSEVGEMLGGAGPAGPAGRGVLVVGHQVEYLRPLAWSAEPLQVRLDVHEVGGARFSIGYLVGDPDEPAVRARTVLAPFDLRAGRVLRLTPEQRAFFAARCVPAEPLRALPRVRFADEEGMAVPLRVRWSDLDSYGHVNNVRFYDYVQEGRLRLLSGLGEQAAVRGRTWLVVRQDVDYRAQLGYRTEPYEVRTAVAELGRSSMTLAARVQDPLDGTVFAESRTVAVCADAQGRPVPVPDSLRAALEPWRVHQPQEAGR